MITVTTHDGLVEALKGDEEYIELRGEDFGWVDVLRDVTLSAWDTSKVYLSAWGTSTVYLRAFDTSKVYLSAWGTSTVALSAWGTSTVYLRAFDTSKVYLSAWGTSTVALRAWGTSTVNLYALDSSTVTEQFIGEEVTINEWNGTQCVTRTKEVTGDITGTELTHNRQPEPCANEGCDELIWETMPGEWKHIQFEEHSGMWIHKTGAGGSSLNCKPLATAPRVATPRKGE